MKKIDWNRAKAESGWIVAGILALTLVGTVFALNPSFQTGPVGPGSFVSPSSFVIFSSGGNYFARNGLTAVVTSNANLNTLLTSVTGALTTGGQIYFKEGLFTLSSTWTITQNALTISGAGADMPNSVPVGESNGTQIFGSIIIENRDITLQDLSIYGNLNITTSPNPYSQVSDFFTARRLYVDGGISGGGVQIVGYAGADDSHIPYQIAFYDSYIAGRTTGSIVAALMLKNVGYHFYFTNTVIVQYGGGSVVWIQGKAIDIAFTNCLLDTSTLGGTFSTVLNLTGSGDQYGIRVVNSVVEINGASNQILIDVGAGASANLIGVEFTDTLIDTSKFQYVVRDALTAHFDWHTITFTRLWDNSNNLAFKSGDAVPKINIRFFDCLFHQAMTVTQANGAYVGMFSNCKYVNPVGLMATPFSGVNPSNEYLSIASSFAGTAAPPASSTITVMDTAVMLRSLGGSGVSITVKDAGGNTLISGASTLGNVTAAYYLPIGYTINFGAFSVAPTVTVIGV